MEIDYINKGKLQNMALKLDNFADLTGLLINYRP
jgi:hypothetical protein